MIHLIDHDSGLRVAWDDEAGSVEVLRLNQYGSVYPARLDLLDQARAGDLPIRFGVEALYVLHDPFHDPADMLRIIAGHEHESTLSAPTLEGVVPTGLDPATIPMQ